MLEQILKEEGEKFDEIVAENINDLLSSGVYSKFPEKDKILIAQNRILSELSTAITHAYQSAQSDTLRKVVGMIEGMRNEINQDGWDDCLDNVTAKLQSIIGNNKN